MVFHEVLSSKRDEVIRRWKANVEGTITPAALRQVELVDHIPAFLDEIVAALREDAGLPATGPSAEEGTIAAGHGAQRLRLGFSLDAVVREYGALRDAIVSTARDASASISFRELHVVSDAIISGIAFAVTQYTQQRDAELLRLANEHFAFVAHELRNPLHSATMALAVLQRKGLLTADARSAGALERALVRTTTLVDQTLTAARVASGIDLKRTPTTLEALFEDAESGAVADAEAKGVELRWVIGSSARVSLDRRLVASALGNLLRNAVKYTAPGGAVEVRGEVANARVVIEIEDTCGGLDPGQIEAAFAPFVRLDRNQTGFGLGLAIAKQAVDAHGGSIRVQNLPHKGCVFVLELPIPSTHLAPSDAARDGL
jgi:signal transduction histidine kinase